MRTGLILAIEMSQRTGSAAVGKETGEILSERLRKPEDADLIPGIDRLLVRAGRCTSDVQAIGVSVGPGGFTGLRVAISTAKMFAETLGVPAIAVPSAIIAAMHCEGKRHVIVCLSSKGTTTWATRVDRVGTEWRVSGIPGLADSNTIDLGGIESCICDDAIPKEIRRRCEESGIAMVNPHCCAANCLIAAEKMISRGETCEASTLRPIYPREPEAVSLWERRLAEQTKGSPGRVVQ